MLSQMYHYINRLIFVKNCSSITPFVLTIVKLWTITMCNSTINKSVMFLTFTHIALCKMLSGIRSDNSRYNHLLLLHAIHSHPALL